MARTGAGQAIWVLSRQPDCFPSSCSPACGPQPIKAS